MIKKNYLLALSVLGVVIILVGAYILDTTNLDMTGGFSISIGLFLVITGVISYIVSIGVDL